MRPHPDCPDKAAIALGRFFLARLPNLSGRPLADWMMPDQAGTRLGSSTIEKRTPAL
jgi:hypothetical protein